MLQILQEPATFNYTRSTPDIQLLTDHTRIDLHVYFGTSLDPVTIVRETYSPLSDTQPLTIRWRDLLHDQLSISLPSTMTAHTGHPDGFRQIGLTIEATGSGTGNTVFRSYTFAKGLLGRQQPDLSLFWRHQWLSGVFHPQTVGLYDPMFLTFIPMSNTDIWADITYQDDTVNTVVLTTAQTHQMMSINVSPGYIQSLAGIQAVKHYEVYGRSGSTETLRRQRYIIDRYTDQLVRDKFVYCNSRGGWDTLILTGESTDERTATIESGIFDEITRQYHISPQLTTTKSGYVQNSEHANQLIEFIYSEQRYHYLHGVAHPINITDPQITLTKLRMNEAEVKFTYADPKMNYPQLEHTPQFLQS